MEIKLDKVCFNDNLKNLSYEFDSEKITCVISSSGSGKTLFSYILAGIEKPTSGVLVNDYKGKKMGYVFENAEESFLFDTVLEELLFTLRRYKYSEDKIKERIESSLKMVSLPESYLKRNPFTLSSGEKTMLSLATILAYNPDLIIMDEPTKYLDNAKVTYLIKLLKKLKTKYHKTIIIFTSDIVFASRLLDNYVILKDGKIFNTGNNKELMLAKDKIKKAKLEVPPIIEFIDYVKKSKNVDLEYTFDVKELMKDIYRNAQ